MLGLAAMAFAGGAHAQQPQSPTPAPLSTQPAAGPEIAPIPENVQRNIDRLQAAALESNLAWEIVEGLVTDVGPRMAGSEAEAVARDWAVARLNGLGFQNVRIQPFTIPFWQAVREDAYIVTLGARPLVAAALGGSPSADVTAEIVRFTSMAALQAAPESAVRGRIVFIDELMARNQDGSGYGPAVRKRGQCAPVAQAKGAVGCVIRSVGTDPHRFAHQGGASRQAPGVSLPAMAISPADADVLQRLLRRGAVRMRLVIEADIRDNAPSGNVIAEIRGRERPDDIVLLVAHLDSWDHGQGAVDDGAGVAIITAAARLIRQLPQRPRRTIRILLAGAEENGLHGAIAYAAAHLNDNHIVASESDFGAGRIWRFRTNFTEAALPYARAYQQALAPLLIAPGDNNAGPGPDLIPLRARTNVPLVELSQDGSDYFDLHHTPDDTLDKIDPAALRQNVAAWVTFAYLAAETDWVYRASE